MHMLLKICFYAQLLALCYCLLDNNIPSATVPVQSNAGLIDIWKELASVKEHLLVATQERNAMQTFLSAANNDIIDLKQKTYQYTKDIEALKGNQSHISISLELENCKAITSQETMGTTPSYQNHCQCEQEIFNVHKALSDIENRLNSVNETDQLIISEFVVIRNEQSGIRRDISLLQYLYFCQWQD